jgi:flagellin
LISEIDRVATTTTFNEQELLDGSFTDKSLQVGAEDRADNRIKISINSMDSAGLGVDSVNCCSDTSAQSAISLVKEGIKKLNEQRSKLGAIQNRLEHTVANLDNVVENTTAAEAAIRDTDMAKEMVKYSNNNILAQAGQAMLAQSNQANQGVLSLLQ